MVSLLAYSIETVVDSGPVVASGLQGLNSVSMKLNPQMSFILNKTPRGDKINIQVIHNYLPFFLFVVGNVTIATGAVVVVVGAGISVSRHICFTST